MFELFDKTKKPSVSPPLIDDLSYAKQKVAEQVFKAATGDVYETALLDFWQETVMRLQAGRRYQTYAESRPEAPSFATGER